MKRIDDMSRENRETRDKLEAENRADREQFKAMLSALKTDRNNPNEDQLSDEEDIAKDASPNLSRRQPTNKTSNEGIRMGMDLINTPHPMQTLRYDQMSARAANHILAQNGHSDTDSSH